MAKPLYFWNGTAWEVAGAEIAQSPIAYQASAPSTPSTGDLWIDSDQDLDTYQRQLVRYKFIASGGETSLSGADANSAVLSYTPGAEQVYLNGALLVRGSDYVATNGTSITSLAALSVNDVVEIFAYVAFNVANTYTQSQVDGLVAPMGLVHIETQSFSAVSSFSFADNTFSSDYENYRIIFYLTAASANSNLLGRLRASGSDDINNVYMSNQMNVTTSTVGGGQTASTFFDFRTYNTTTRTIHSFDLFMPNLAENTHYVDTYYTYNDSGAYQAGLQGGVFRADTVFDSFSIITGSGTISGVARCYGYKD